MLYFTLHSFNENIQWKVKRDPICRLLDKKEWLDNFFNNGEIFISCFNQFRGYENEIQGDANEGEALCWFEDDKGNTHGLQYEAGLNSFILSTTTELTEQSKADFRAVGAIKIVNPTAFALALARKLPFCTSGTEGKCNYQEGRVFKLKNYEKLAELIKKPEYFLNPDFQLELLTLTQEFELFLKKKKYESQNEYRLVWFTAKKQD